MEKDNEGFVKTNQSFNLATTDNMEKQEISTFEGYTDDGQHFIQNLTARNISFCSMKPKNEDEEIILFNAMNNPENRIKDCIGETINVKDVFVEVVFPENEVTHEKNACPRIVLIDDKGIGYQAVSLGVYSAVKKCLDSFGTPDTWKNPKQFKIKQISKGTRSLLTLEAVRPAKK
jgi:hypothetical protein